MLMLTKSLHSVSGLGKWADAVKAAKHSRPKTRKMFPSRGKSLLSTKGLASGPGESAAIHYAQTSLLDFNDGVKMSDDDPAVERTVEMLSIAESDASALEQEKEARSSGGITSR